MSTNGELEQKLEQGVAAARSGDRATARRLLLQVVEADPRNELAWIWLASVATTAKDRRTCLERVLAINPNNTRAKEALARMGDEGAGEGGAVGREQLTRLRQMQRAGQQRQQPAGSDGFNLRAWLIGIGGTVAIVAIVFIASTVFRPGPPPTVIPTRVPVVTNTPPPATPTPTPFDVSSITRSAPTLPPTFTPTYTPLPSDTPTPEPTAYPLVEFVAFLVSREPDAVAPGLYRMNGDGTGEIAFLDNVLDVAYDPTGNRIALVRRVDYEPDETFPEATSVTELFLAPADNPAAAEQFTTLRRASAHSPAWSPDGRQLVYVTDWDGDDELWVIDVGNGQQRQITFNEGIDRDPVWTPDGRGIVYASEDTISGDIEIYRLTFAETDQNGNPIGENTITQFTDASGSSYSPTFSPDGALIAFISDRRGDGDVYIMNSEGEGEMLLTVSDGDAEDRSPVFTSNGEWVAFVSNRDGATFQTYVVDLQGRVLTRLTNNGREDVMLDYRPELIFRVRGQGQ